MKILLLTRATLFKVRGGDTSQLEKTAKYLRMLGVQADIMLSDQQIDYSNYDLIHFFNIVRPADIMYHARRCGKPFVISTIYTDYDSYDHEARGGMVGLLRKIFSADALEYFKVIARFLRNGEKIRSYSYILKGHRRSIRELIRDAVLLLPNSESEMQRLRAAYGLNARYHVIPNGVDNDWFGRQDETQSQKREGVLCAAQVEGRKNQLNLIRAMKDLPFHLTIVGTNPPNFGWYMKACKKEAGANVHFIPRVEEEPLMHLYRTHKVHALASWFETTGLVSLEAAIMGCALVISPRGDTREYFGEEAWYCEPDDVASIREAILKAYHAGPSAKLTQTIKEHFTWEKAAEKTKAAYVEALRSPL